MKLFLIVEQDAGLLHADNKSEESSFFSEYAIVVIPQRHQIENWSIKPMALCKIDEPRFEVERFDGRTNYLLWEQQVKNVIKAMSLGKVFKLKPLNVNDEDWNEIQNQTMSIVTFYLKPYVLQ